MTTIQDDWEHVQVEDWPKLTSAQSLSQIFILNGIHGSHFCACFLAIDDIKNRRQHDSLSQMAT